MMGMLSVNLASCGSDDDDEPTPPERLSVTPTEISLLSQAGSSASFTITTNTRWTVSCMADWLNLSAKSGEGNYTITVTATSKNAASANERTAQILVQAGSLSQVITVSQMAGLSKVQAIPTNIVALCNGIAWDVEDIEAARSYKVLLFSEEEYEDTKKIDLFDLLDSPDVESHPLTNQSRIAYCHDKEHYYGYGRSIVGNTVYYICTLAYDDGGMPGEVVATKVKTPAAVDSDNDARTFVSFSGGNVSGDIFSFFFNCEKMGLCDTYHVIMGNMDALYSPVLYAFEIKYYLEHGEMHWSAKQAGMKIITNRPNNDTFTYSTDFYDLLGCPFVFCYTWGMYKDGRFSSCITGGELNVLEESDIKKRKMPRNFKSEKPMVFKDLSAK